MADIQILSHTPVGFSSSSMLFHTLTFALSFALGRQPSPNHNSSEQMLQTPGDLVLACLYALTDLPGVHLADMAESRPIIWSGELLSLTRSVR
jgi:hypothetical protein